MTFQITGSALDESRLAIVGLPAPLQLAAVEPCVAVHACLLRRDLLLGRRLIVSTVCLREKCYRHDTHLFTNGTLGSHAAVTPPILPMWPCCA